MATNSRNFFFAGGGTAGHIYPSIAVAEKIVGLEPMANIHFFCSMRRIDAQILAQSRFTYSSLPAKGFSLWPGNFFGFSSSFFKSYRTAKKIIAKANHPVVVGVGGFVAAPVCLAAHKLKVPVVLLNVDLTPGKANKMIAHWADEIFAQFEETTEYFTKTNAKVTVVGCPLRGDFENLEPDKAVAVLGLDKDKRTLLVTGASSGSEHINEAICLLLQKLNDFSNDWQIVHITGVTNCEKVESKYIHAKISHRVLGYYNDMPNLLAAADLAVGRSGAVSVAEYAVAGVPSICIPYPYHRDKHQYLNANKLVEAGTAVIVDDLADAEERADNLWKRLLELMKDEKKRAEMSKNCARIANTTASSIIAEKLLAIRG